jgi:putative oxidoreductase
MNRLRAIPVWLEFILRLIVGGVFIYASLDKIQNPGSFAAAVANYRILPYIFLHPAALYLPWLEMVCGMALIIGIQKRGAAWIISIMTAIFMIAITVALSRGLDISCGCFNTEGGHGVGISLLGRDALLLAASLILALRPTRRSEKLV